MNLVVAPTLNSLSVSPPPLIGTVTVMVSVAASTFLIAPETDLPPATFWANAIPFQTTSVASAQTAATAVMIDARFMGILLGTFRNETTLPAMCQKKDNFFTLGHAKWLSQQFA